MADGESLAALSTTTSPVVVAAGARDERRQWMRYRRKASLGKMGFLPVALLFTACALLPLLFGGLQAFAFSWLGLRPGSSRRYHSSGTVSRSATSAPGFFPGDPSLAPPTPPPVLSPVAANGNAAAALAAENRLLREQLQLLVQEIRLLRASLTQGDEQPQDTPAAAEAPVSPPVSSATSVPAPGPAEPAPSAQSTFPTAPAAAPASTFPTAPASAAAPSSTFPTASAPAKPSRSTFPTAPSPSSFPTAPPPRQPVPSTFPVASPAAPPTAATAEPIGVDQATARVVSAGYENGNLANFYVDGHRIVVADAEADRRGLNVVVVDPEAGRVVYGRAYDIWGNPFEENKKLAADIGALPDGHIVLAALKDSGMENIDGNLIRALQTVGSTVSSPLAMREGYALIGVKGGVAIAERRGSEAEIEGVLPCTVQRLLSTAPLPPSSTASQQVGTDRGPVTDTQVASPAPAMSVDPKGQVSVRDAEAEVEGQNWEEVLLMLDKLQEKIQAKRLGRDVPQG